MDTYFEETLHKQGYLVYKTRGASMKPLLVQNRDLVTIRPLTRPIRRYDVPLYRRRGPGGTVRYVLHRVVKINPDGTLIIRGDNTYTDETDIGPDDILGVMTACKRKGRMVSTEDLPYRLYVRIWCALYPARRAARYPYRALRRIARIMRHR